MPIIFTDLKPFFLKYVGFERLSGTLNEVTPHGKVGVLSRSLLDIATA
jgi:hypothetical protein